MRTSEHAVSENAVTQQPAMSQPKTRILIACVVVFGAAPTWAGGQGLRPSDAPLLRAATTESAEQGGSLDEAERMRSRIRQRMREQRGLAAPYGTGYEARRNMGAETGAEVPRMERIERIDRIERPDRVDRPVIERGGRGGR